MYGHLDAEQKLNLALNVNLIDGIRTNKKGDVLWCLKPNNQKK